MWLPLISFCILLHATEHLGIHNMREVLDFFWDYRSKWKLIGIGLGIDSGTLDSINKNEGDVEDCLIELIKVWLRGKMATMSVMSAVLQSKPVAGGVPSVPDKLPSKLYAIVMQKSVTTHLSEPYECNVFFLQLALKPMLSI